MLKEETIKNMGVKPENVPFVNAMIQKEWIDVIEPQGLVTICPNGVRIAQFYIDEFNMDKIDLQIQAALRQKDVVTLNSLYFGVLMYVAETQMKAH